MTRLQLERAQVWHCVAAIAVGGTAGLLWPPTGNSFVVLPFTLALPPEWRLAGAVTRETYGRAFGFERSNG